MVVLTVSPYAAIDRRFSGLKRCATGAPSLRLKSPDFQKFCSSLARFRQVWCGRRTPRYKCKSHTIRAAPRGFETPPLEKPADEPPRGRNNLRT